MTVSTDPGILKVIIASPTKEVIMKIMWATILMLSFSSLAYGEALRDVLDRQAEERHEAQKEWDQNKNECRVSFPKWHDSSHPDYDKNFDCQKKVKKLRYELDDKHSAEVCQKFNVCRR